MNRLQKHLRNTFLAGIFAAIPLAITAYIFWKLWEFSDQISLKLFKIAIPLIGVVIAIGLIYALGLFATSVLGKMVLKLIDALLSRLPLVRALYIAWKQIALTPGGTEGIYSRVVLMPDETNHLMILGFTSGRAIEGDPDTLCIFAPGSPNPINGKLYFVKRDKCRFLDISTEDAFKIILSTGNYVPKAVGGDEPANQLLEQ